MCSLSFIHINKYSFSIKMVIPNSLVATSSIISLLDRNPANNISSLPSLPVFTIIHHGIRRVGFDPVCHQSILRYRHCQRHRGSGSKSRYIVAKLDDVIALTAASPLPPKRVSSPLSPLIRSFPAFPYSFRHHLLIHHLFLCRRERGVVR